ncbi:hypothetical protein MXB_3383 [Myxobolus squamalis]|nr:hypothetical protein MXB_3383 [Myxobolus squamalis]
MLVYLSLYMLLFVSCRRKISSHANLIIKHECVDFSAKFCFHLNHAMINSNRNLRGHMVLIIIIGILHTIINA